MPPRFVFVFKRWRTRVKRKQTPRVNLGQAVSDSNRPTRAPGCLYGSSHQHHTCLVLLTSPSIDFFITDTLPLIPRPRLSPKDHLHRIDNYLHTPTPQSSRSGAQAAVTARPLPLHITFRQHNDSFRTKPLQSAGTEPT